MSDNEPIIHHPDAKPTSAEAAAAGEDDTWQNEQIVDPDDAQRAADDPEADEEEGETLS
jgi:hypothetical protein